VESVEQKEKIRPQDGENRDKIGHALMTAAREAHVSAFCDAVCHSTWIWRHPCHTATSSTVNKQLPIITAPTEAGEHI
jgi:hypothetical protein